jgi:CheY-like chemotaxis protein
MPLSRLTYHDETHTVRGREGGVAVEQRRAQKREPRSAERQPRNATMMDEPERGSDDLAESRVPRVVLVEDDSALCATLRRTLGSACQTVCVDPLRAAALLQSLDVVDVALVDCDQPPSVQAPIFRELARWPHALCVLMSANAQKVEQFRALGVFAPLVLDKPIQPDALEAIRSATLELALHGFYGGEPGRSPGDNARPAESQG